MYIKPFIKKTKVDIGEKFLVGTLMFILLFFSLLFFIKIW
jgi:hypothetical protein